MGFHSREGVLRKIFLSGRNFTNLLHLHCAGWAPSSLCRLSFPTAFMCRVTKGKACLVALPFQQWSLAPSRWVQAIGMCAARHTRCCQVACAERRMIQDFSQDLLPRKDEPCMVCGGV
jgi:hypothetical protein